MDRPASLPTTADAETLFESGDLPAALDAWRALGAVDPAAARPRGRIAACLVGLGRFEEAAEILRPLAREQSGNPLVHDRLAVADAARGEADRAVAALAAAADAGLRPMSGIDSEPALAALHDDPRFSEVRDRIVANDAPTAGDPAFRAFDFWVGDWEARTDDGVLQGHNRITILLGGAAILETWSGATGYRGTSLNRYDRSAGTWRQTWVDDQGDVVEFVNGQATPGRVAFEATDADGGLRRLTFTEVGPDAFRQVSERSSDGGATWTVEYDFHYRRLAAALTS
jgi:hypothetical protein